MIPPASDCFHFKQVKHTLLRVETWQGGGGGEVGVQSSLWLLVQINGLLLLLVETAVQVAYVTMELEVTLVLFGMPSTYGMLTMKRCLLQALHAFTAVICYVKSCARHS